MAKKKKPETIKKTVIVTSVVEVEFDASIMPDDEWRSVFYSHIRTHDDLAEFFASNLIIHDPYFY